MYFLCNIYLQPTQDTQVKSWICGRRGFDVTVNVEQETEIQTKAYT